MELANVFCIEKVNFKLNKDNILGKLDNPREGDFVENSSLIPLRVIPIVEFFFNLKLLSLICNFNLLISEILYTLLELIYINFDFKKWQSFKASSVDKMLFL